MEQEVHLIGQGSTVHQLIRESLSEHRKQEGKNPYFMWNLTKVAVTPNSFSSIDNDRKLEGFRTSQNTICTTHNAPTSIISATAVLNGVISQ
jgi:hypothetical protein